MVLDRLVGMENTVRLLAHRVSLLEALLAGWSPPEAHREAVPMPPSPVSLIGERNDLEAPLPAAAGEPDTFGDA